MRPLTRFERVNISLAGILLISLFLVFNYFLAIIASVVQAVVFCLLTTIYLALVMEPAEESN